MKSKEPLTEEIQAKLAEAEALGFRNVHVRKNEVYIARSINVPIDIYKELNDLRFEFDYKFEADLLLDAVIDKVKQLKALKKFKEEKDAKAAKD